MLGVANHGNRNVADEHYSLKVLGLLVEFLELCADLHRVLPVSSEDVGLQTIVLQSVPVGIYLSLAGLVSSVVNDNCKRVALL